VVNDVTDAIAAYTGTQHVRRTGQTVQVTRVMLLYDAAGVPPRLRKVIKDTVKEFDAMHAGKGLRFEVWIL
jgi:hypothetical protein